MTDQQNAYHSGSGAMLQVQLAALGYDVPDAERSTGAFGPGTAQALQAFQREAGLTDADPAGVAAALSRAVSAATYTVQGRVTGPTAGAEGLTVALLDHNVGGSRTLATTRSDPDGRYFFRKVIAPADLRSYRKTKPDLSIDVSRDDAVLAASAIRYAAPPTLTFDIVLPASAPGLPSEYECLLAAVGTVYDGPLTGLRQDAGQQDLSYIAARTGWPVTALAQAVAAGQMAESDKLPAPLLYALFRADVPAEATALFRTVPRRVMAIWRSAIAGYVVPAVSADALQAALKAFTTRAAARLASAEPPVGISTMQEMVQASLPDDAGQQAQFIDLLATHAGDDAGLWQAATAAFGAETSTRLQFMGQLYTVTLNNAPMVAALFKAEQDKPLATMRDLADRGYYRPEKWQKLIGGAVPGQIAGADETARLQGYAQFLASQIRLAYPNAAIADQVQSRALPMPAADDTVAEVADFLKAQQDDFTLGRDPIEAYLQHAGRTLSDGAVLQMKRLHRAYQLTQDDAHTAVLLRNNLDSAYAVTRHDEAGFVRRFAAQLGGEAAATALHRRAKQVFNTVLNTAVTYMIGRTRSGIGSSYNAAIGPVLGAAVQAQAAAADAVPSTIPTATLENLFGSLDYCNCSDCTSILSPAAYFVDLLNFIDNPAPALGLQDPQAVLFTRRPDLQSLALTCENTDTALPYIDIVNEVLEYYVANALTLQGFEGFNTDPAATSAALIASPQNVDDAAYIVLQGALFPPPLPFNRPLALLRQQLQNLGIALPDAMLALRSSDTVPPPKAPLSYGWTDILLERLTISRDEYQLFQAASLALGDLYGLTNASALARLQAMTLDSLSRRIGLDYDSLATLIQTQFVNPNAGLIPRLNALQMPFTTFLALSNGTITPAAFQLALPAGLDARAYGGATATDDAKIAAWVVANIAAILQILVFSPVGGAAPDPATQCTGAAWQLGYSNPDSTSNLPGTIDYTRLARFIRLWQKLSTLFGVAADASTIAQTDQIFAALYPAADLPIDPGDATQDAANRALLDAGFQVMLLRLGFLVDIIDMLSLTPSASLQQLLACWAPIGTYGHNSLYSLLFLTPARLQQDQEAQTATLAGSFFAGEGIATTINGKTVTYTVAAGDTPASIATAVAAAINADVTDIDPASELPLNARFFAASAGGVVTVQAGFTLACASSGAAGSYAVTTPAPTPVQQSATVAATAAQAGVVLTTTINGVPIGYTVGNADLEAPSPAASIAAGIAAAIGNCTIADPYSGLPINNLVGASTTAGDATVNLVAANSGAPFTLGCAILPVSGAYVLSGFNPGGVASLTFAGQGTYFGQIEISQTAPWQASTGFSFGITQNDLVSMVAVLAVQYAQFLGTAAPFVSANQNVLTTNLAALRGVSLAVSIGNSPGLACTVVQPTLASRTATINGPVSAGAILQTTINGDVIDYTVTATDTAATIAGSIAAAINGNADLGPQVSASAADAVLTVTELTAPSATPFSMTCSLIIPGSFIAGVFGNPLHMIVVMAVQPGDLVTITIDTIPVTYQTQPSDFDANILTLAGAINIANAIHAATTIDPVLGVALGSAFVARPFVFTGVTLLRVILLVPQGPQVAIAATRAAAGNPAPTPLRIIIGTAQQVITVLDPIPVDTLLTTAIDGVDVVYQVVAGDTATTIATAVAAAINATTIADQSSGQPLNTVVGASASGGSIIVDAKAPGVPFALTTGISSGSYTSGRRRSPFVDDGYGNYLNDMTQRLFGYEPLICAACNLSGAEFSEIASFLGYDVTTPLSLAAVSALFRYAWLAHTLGISVVEFLALRTATRLDPFVMLDPAATPPVEPPAILFIRMLQRMSTAGLAPVQALYLLWGNDITGAAAPPDTDITGLAFTLRADFTAVEAQFTLKSDPDGSIARALTTLVYGSAATDFLFGLLVGTVTDTAAIATFFVTYPELQPLYTQYSAPGQTPQTWQPALLAAILPTLKRVRKEQQALAAISAAVGLDQSFANALLQDAAVLQADGAAGSPAVADLVAVESQGLSAAVFLGNDPTAAADISIDAMPPGLTLAALALGGTPTAGDVLTATIDGTAVSCTVGAQDTSLALLAQSLATALNAATAIDATTGLPLNQRLRAVASGNMVLLLGTDPGGLNQPLGLATATLPATASETLAVTSPAAPLAVRWTGYLTVPQDGAYSIGLNLDTGAAASVTLGGAVLAGVISPGAAAGSIWRSTAGVALTAGTLTPMVITVTGISSAAAIAWQSTGLGWQAIPGAYLYADMLVSHLRRCYVRFLKASSLAATLLLTADEIAWLGTTGEAGWLNLLADRQDLPATADNAATLTQVLAMLLDYARMKRALAPSDTRLLAIMQAPATDSIVTALCSLTGWSIASVNALLTHFFQGMAPGPLIVVESLARIFDAYALLSQCRVSAATLIAAVTNTPSTTTVSALQSALRALYAEPDWQTVIKPINDGLRMQCRDALVAYILKRFADLGSDIATADQLFEYFLVDTQNEPAVQTSRIRLALSSVQLFIERIIRGLEPGLAMSASAMTQWVWMKRYRVWQANREIFLWPENWLYPELRDNPSPLFQTAMSRLQQSDITGDAASDAYLDYLTGLEEVAKLEPSGLYHVPAAAGPPATDAVSYAVARTAGAKRKYFFRSTQGGSWTPWNEVSIECEDAPLTPVVWGGRLMLFWLKIVKQSPDPHPTPSTNTTTVASLRISDLQTSANASIDGQGSHSVPVAAILHWAEYYNGKWQPAKASDVGRPTALGTYDPKGNGSIDTLRDLLTIVPAFVGQNAGRLGVTLNFGDALLLSIEPAPYAYSGNIGLLSQWPQFALLPGRGYLLHNTHSRPISFDDLSVGGYPMRVLVDPAPWGRQLDPTKIYTGGSETATFSIDYVTNTDSNTPTTTVYSVSLFTYEWAPRFTPSLPLPDQTASWSSPFFYEDRKRLFYVETTAITSVSTDLRQPSFGILRTPQAMLSAAPAIKPLTLRS